jgi:hypothetical protein
MVELFFRSKTLVEALVLLYLFGLCVSGTCASDFSRKAVEEATWPLPEEMKEYGDQIKREMHACKDLDLLFQIAWRVNKYGFIGKWEDGYEREIREYLSQNPNALNGRDLFGRTPLMHAAAAPNPGYFWFLCRLGAKMDSEDVNRYNVLHISNLTTRFVPQGIMADALDGIYFHDDLAGAVMNRNLPKLSQLFDRGVSPNHVLNGHFLSHTLLMLAAKRNDITVARFLLEHGADINAVRSGDPETALGVAVEYERYEMTQFLLSQKPAPRMGGVCKFGGSLTMASVECHDNRLLTVLLAHGALQYETKSTSEILADIQREASMDPKLITNSRRATLTCASKIIGAATR